MPNKRYLIQMANLILLALSIVLTYVHHTIWIREFERLQESVMSVKDSHDRRRQEHRVEIERIVDARKEEASQ